MSGSISPSLLETVARRVSILDHLLEESADKRDLEGALDVSRATIDRAINSLSEAGCIDYQDGVWEMTLLGRLAHNNYKQLAREYEGLTLAQPVLRHLSTKIPLDADILIDADIHLAQAPAPHAPIQHLEKLLEQSQQVKGMSPVTLPKYIDLFYNQIVTQNTDTDLVLGDEVVEYLWLNYHSDMDDALKADNCRMWRLEDEPPFGLVLVDREAIWIGVHGDDGGLKGAIVNNTESAISWASDVFYSHQEQGENVLLRGGTGQSRNHHLSKRWLVCGDH